MAYATSVGTPHDAASGGGSLPVAPGLDHARVRRPWRSARRVLAAGPRGPARRGWRASPARSLTVDKMEEGPPTGKPVNIEISGDDFDVLGELAAQVQERIRGVDGPGRHRRQLRPRPARDAGPAGRGEGRALRPADLRHRRHGAHRPARRRDGQVPRRRGRVRHHRAAISSRSAGRSRTCENATVFYEGTEHPAVRLRPDRVRARAWPPSTASTPGAWSP